MSAPMSEHHTELNLYKTSKGGKRETKGNVRCVGCVDCFYFTNVRMRREEDTVHNYIQNPNPPDSGS